MTADRSIEDPQGQQESERTAAASEEARYRRAKARVEALRGLYVHAGVYLIVNGFLFLLNLLTSPGNLWFYWPLLGWALDWESTRWSSSSRTGRSARNGRSARSAS